LKKQLKNIIKISALILWLPALLFIISVIYSRMNSEIAYSPNQPMTFSHKVHSGDYNIKCLFCHHEAETQTFSALPTTFSCMVCHVALKSESKLIQPLIESYDKRKPIQWVGIHKLPEYVKFNHNSHILSGIDCASCHGNVEQMEKTERTRDFTMSWCLNCHRNPRKYIIPSRNITGIFVYNTLQKNEIKLAKSKPKTKPSFGSYITENIIERHGIKATKLPGRGPENCSACHY